MRSIALSLLVTGATALNNGVGKLPKMGYNSKAGSKDSYAVRANYSSSIQCLWL